MTTMKSRLIGTITAVVLLAALVPAALAAPKATTPGTPGDPDCHGQTVRYFAQIAHYETVDGVDMNPGIGNLVKASGFSMQQVQDIVDLICTPPPGTP